MSTPSPTISAWAAPAFDAVAAPTWAPTPLLAAGPGPGLRAAGLAMAFKLIESAQDRWRAVNGPHLVALVRAGAHFEKGVMVEREQQDQKAVA